MTLPLILKQLRTELQLRQKELAELLHVNALTVNRWERGKTHPNKAIGIALLRVAKERGASEVCLTSLRDVLDPTLDIEKKANDLRYTELDSINQLVNEAPNGIMVVGPEDDVLYVNDRMSEILGVSMEKASTTKSRRLLAQGQTGAACCRENKKSREKRSPKDGSSVGYRELGGKYYVIHTKQIIWKGQPSEIHYFTDISELHELQTELQKQQEALNCAAQFAGMQVARYDIQKNTATLMTTATPDARGLPKKVENFDTAAREAGIIPAEYQKVYSRMIREIQEGKPQAEAEVRTNEPDGTSNRVHYQMNLTARDKDGKPLTAIFSARVITREKSPQGKIRVEDKRVIDEQKKLSAFEMPDRTEKKTGLISGIAAEEEKMK